MTQSLVIKSAELVIAPPGAERDVRTILHTLTLGKGWVFGLSVVEHKDELGKERLAHILSSHLEHLAADLSQDTNVVRRFEQTLSRVNRDLSKAARELNLNLDRFHTVIGVLARSQVFLSGVGHLKALFLHKTAERRYVIYELDSQFSDGPNADEQRTWDKPLIAVLDGEIHPGDIFYLATPIAKLALSLSELQDILVTLPPAGALQRIRQYLGATEHYGALAFHALEEDKTGIVRKANPINSLQELEHTKDRTASVLGDQQPDLVNALKELGAKINQKLASPGVKGFQTFLKRALVLLVRVVSAGLAWLATGLIKLKDTLSRRWAERRQAPKSLRHGHLRTHTGQGLHPLSSVRKFVGGLSAKQRLALVGFVTVLAIFILILSVNAGHSERKQAQVAFDKQAQAIADQLLTAEASLIYKNTSEAARTLSEAAVALEALPKDTNEHQAEAEKLAKKLSELQATVRGVTFIQPTELADLGALDNQVSLLSTTGTVDGLIALGDNLGVYKLDALQKTWSKLETVTGPMSRIVSSTTEGNNVLVIDSTQQLGRVDLGGLSLSSITSGTNGLASAEDITVYNDNLYALTGASQQIVKMRPQAPNYESGTAWITAHATDLSTARALTIDSDIYILLANDVIKFTSGREQDNWQLSNVDPPLTQPIKLWTSPESAYLYILDPAEKRLVVINKDTGGVQAQYVADEFTGAIGMVVDEPTSKIVVMTATKAWEFTPQHLLK